jgi:transposase
MMRHIADEADQIYLAVGATDFRKQQNGLASLVALKFKLDPHSYSSVFLFCNKRRNALRALRWDKNGFVLVTKSLSNDMKFQWPKNSSEVCNITKRQLDWLLQGLNIEQKKAHPDSIDTTGMIF